MPIFPIACFTLVVFIKCNHVYNFYTLLVRGSFFYYFGFIYHFNFPLVSRWFYNLPSALPFIIKYDSFGRVIFFVFCKCPFKAMQV